VLQYMSSSIVGQSPWEQGVKPQNIGQQFAKEGVKVLDISDNVDRAWLQ
jgi:hypothetical protein